MKKEKWECPKCRKFHYVGETDMKTLHWNAITHFCVGCGTEMFVEKTDDTFLLALCVPEEGWQEA